MTLILPVEVAQERARELAKLAPAPGAPWQTTTAVENAMAERARLDLGMPWFWSETWRHVLKGLKAIRSLDYFEGEIEPRWHLSVSATHGIPDWRELGYCRDALLPADVFLCVQHPPRKHWMNFHPNVLHLLELRDNGLIQQSIFEGENARALGKNKPSDGRPAKGAGRGRVVLP